MKAKEAHSVSLCLSNGLNSLDKLYIRFKSSFILPRYPHNIKINQSL